MVVLSAATIGAIGSILIGLLTGKYFLIFLGLIIFALPFFLTLSIPPLAWIAIIFIGLFMLIGKKK